MSAHRLAATHDARLYYSTFIFKKNKLDRKQNRSSASAVVNKCYTVIREVAFKKSETAATDNLEGSPI